MKTLIFTIFPEFFDRIFNFSVLKNARQKKIFEIETKNLYDFGVGKFKKIDEKIFGGGTGMLIRPEIVRSAREFCDEKFGAKNFKLISVDPTGEKFSQKMAEKFSREKNLAFFSGAFVGVDARAEKFFDAKISLGDFVLTSGEFAIAPILNAILRLRPNFLKNSDAVAIESFSQKIFGQKEFPQFCAPVEFENEKVPEILRGGNHAKIENWRFANLRGISAIEKKVVKFRRENLPRKTRNLIFKNPEIANAKIFQKWVSDAEIIKNLIIEPGFSLADEIEFIENSARNLKFLLVSIFEKTTKNLIGNASLEIRDDGKIAEFGILIGEKNFHGRGFGTEILKEFLKIAFEDLNLEKVVSRVFAKNLASQKIHEKCGFRKAGFFEKDFFKKDGPRDCFYFEKLRG